MAITLSSLLPKTLDTENLILELYNGSDEHVNCILAARNNAIVYAMVGDGGVYDKDELEKRMATSRVAASEFRCSSDEVEVDIDIAYLMRDRNIASYHGFVAVHQKQGRLVEMAWATVPTSMGKGYATEAGKALLDMTQTILDICDIAFPIDGQNVASWRIAEKIGLLHVRDITAGDINYKIYAVAGVAVDDEAARMMTAPGSTSALYRNKRKK